MPAAQFECGDYKGVIPRSAFFQRAEGSPPREFCLWRCLLHLKNRSARDDALAGDRVL